MNTSTFISQIEIVTKEYALQLFQKVLPGTIQLFGAFIMIWFIVYLIWYGCLKSSLSWSHTSTKLFQILLIHTLLVKSSYLWTYLFNPLYKITINLAHIILSYKGKTLNSIIHALELKLNQVFQMASVIQHSGAFYRIDYFFAALIFLIPFIILWGLFIAQVLEFHFRMMLMMALSPILIITLSFSITRSIGYQSFIILLQSCFSFLFHCLAMGISVFTLSYALKGIPIKDNHIPEAYLNWIWSHHYWLIIIIGYLAILGHKRASTISSQVFSHFDPSTYQHNTITRMMAQSSKSILSIFQSHNKALYNYARSGKELFQGMVDNPRVKNILSLIRKSGHQ